jgi:hypothetical protein
MYSPHKAYPCLARRAIHIMPHPTSLGNSVTQPMVPGGPRPTTARGQSMGRHAVGPTTHPTKPPPPKKNGYRCLPRHAIRIQPHHSSFKDSVKRLMVRGGGHRTTFNRRRVQAVADMLRVSKAENWPLLATPGDSSTASFKPNQGTRREHTVCRGDG